MRHYSAFTLIELMLALTFTAILMLCVVEVYSQTQRRYTLLSMVSHRQLRGDYATLIIEHRLKQADSCHAVTRTDLSSVWRRRLKPVSHVIECQIQHNWVRFYISKASWQHQSKKVMALFEKINMKPRLELVPFISNLKAVVNGRVLSFMLTATFPTPVLLMPINRHKVPPAINWEQQWYGVVVMPKKEHQNE